MAFGAISRVSDQMRSHALLNTMRRNNVETARVQHQLSTGDRMVAPSHDPASANQAMTLQRLLAQQGQLDENLTNALNIFNMTDSALADATELLRDAAGVANIGVDSTTNQAVRDELASQVQSLIDSMYTVANTRVGEVYIFAGANSTSPAFAVDGSGIRYAGGAQATRAHLGDVTPTAVGATGDEVFRALSCEVSGYRDLSPALTLDTRLADLDGAAYEGIRLGTIIVQDAGGKFAVDLSGCDRVGDVIDRINEAAAANGSGVEALLPEESQTLEISSTAGGLKITELGGGKAAHDLGIYRPTEQGNYFAGDELRPRVVATTALSDLAGGAGIDIDSGLVITNGGKTETIDVSPATTVGELLSIVNTADAGVLARINESGTGIDIVNTTGGTEMRIGENGGTTADDLGVRSLRGATHLADMNDGFGVYRIEGKADLRITARNGDSFEVDLNDAETLDDAITAINEAAADAGVGIVASMKAVGNGIRLDDATGGAGQLQAISLNSSTAAEDLGIHGAVEEDWLDGTDTHPITPSGVFANLAKLRDALAGAGEPLRPQDVRVINDIAARIDDDLKHVIALRGRIGGLVQDLENRQLRLEDQTMANQTLLSAEKDVDFTEAITEFSALQTALQANLMAGSQSMNMSLLDFLR